VSNEDEAAASQARREAAVQRLLAQRDTEEATSASPAPVVPAGWYPDPQKSTIRRYWNGNSWTEHTAPADQVPTTPRPDASAPRTRDHDETAFAWTLAVLPLLWLPVDYFAPAFSAATGTIIAAIVLNGALATADSKRLAGRSINVSPMWGWLLVPVYLFQRTARASSTPLIPIVWCATFALSLLGTFTFAASYEFDGEAEGRRIERGIERQSGLDRVRVSCPDETVHDGDVIWCRASSPDSASVEVRLDIHGDVDGFTYDWQAVP
jgi:hypothetical protein